MIVPVEGVRLPNFAQRWLEGPYVFYLIGSRRLGCAHFWSDWDFCVQSDDPHAQLPSWQADESAITEWLRRVDFRKVYRYNDSRDVNTMSVWERGPCSPSKVNVLVERDAELCVTAFDVVQRRSELLRTRHDTKMWDQLYKSLSLGIPGTIGGPK